MSEPTPEERDDNSCGNVPCILRIGKVKGMHTNGRCRCTDLPAYKLRIRIDRKLRAAMQQARRAADYWNGTTTLATGRCSPNPITTQCLTLAESVGLCG